MTISSKDEAAEFQRVTVFVQSRSQVMGQVFNARKSEINRRLLISNLAEHSVKTFSNILNSCYFSQLLKTYTKCGASFVAQLVKNLLAMQETWVQFLGQEEPLEKGMATYSSILAGKIPWTEEPGGLQSMGLQRVRHD